MYLTQTDLIIRGIQNTAPLGKGEIIKNLIEEDVDSDEKKSMQNGVNYYKGKHDICDRRITYYLDRVLTEDTTKTNNKVVHTFHKILIDQKTAYIVGNPIVLNIEDEIYLETLQDKLGEDFPDFCNKWVKNASNKGVEWLHPYINEKGEFSYVIINAEQIIAVYDSRYEKELQEIIRYYKVKYVDNNNNEKSRYKVEWWTSQQVEFYQEDENGYYYPDPDEEENPRPHWKEFNTIAPERKEGKAWGKVPFVPLKNNDESLSDLEFYKSLVDDYDLNVSDFSNNLCDIQDAIWVLRGYEGTSLKEFLHNLKTFKAIKVSEDGGVEPQKNEISKDARDSHLDRLEDNIFTFGMGVNPKMDKFGQNPSGIALKFLYGLIDLKSNMLIRKMKTALREFFWFVTEYINMSENKKFDYTEIETIFNKSLIINEAEKIQSGQQSKGVISDETIIENHPWVDNIELEMTRLKEQNTIDLDEVEYEEED